MAFPSGAISFQHAYRVQSLLQTRVRICTCVCVRVYVRARGVYRTLSDVRPHVHTSRERASGFRQLTRSFAARSRGNYFGSMTDTRAPLCPGRHRCGIFFLFSSRDCDRPGKGTRSFDRGTWIFTLVSGRIPRQRLLIVSAGRTHER